MKKTLTSSRLGWQLAAAFLAAGLLGAAALLSGHFFTRNHGEGNQERFLRAVYILQFQGGPAAEETLFIPARIRHSDLTESWLHHPDTIFVLRFLAGELAYLRQSGESRAGLYEAYARIGLGEPARAADLLSAYVAEHAYEPRHYIILCGLLEELGEFPTLLRFCAEWRERDPGCLPERAIFAWTALFMEGRHDEARQYMADDRSACLGPWRLLYAARAAMAAGFPDQADELLDLAKAENLPEANVLLLWQQLMGKGP